MCPVPAKFFTHIILVILTRFLPGKYHFPILKMRKLRLVASLAHPLSHRWACPVGMASGWEGGHPGFLRTQPALKRAGPHPKLVVNTQH